MPSICDIPCACTSLICFNMSISGKRSRHLMQLNLLKTNNCYTGNITLGKGPECSTMQPLRVNNVKQINNKTIGLVTSRSRSDGYVVLKKSRGVFLQIISRKLHRRIVFSQLA